MPHAHCARAGERDRADSMKALFIVPLKSTLTRNVKAMPLNRTSII